MSWGLRVPFQRFIFRLAESPTSEASCLRFCRAGGPVHTWL
uniref:Uncharacterized protein n=1 Tax=Anguilla anguilla TaxID=7936 RepID=A0A0E9Q613_ANGAN